MQRVFIHISMWSNFSFSFFISQGNFVGWSANYKFYVGKWMRSKGSKSTRHHVPIDCADDARFAPFKSPKNDNAEETCVDSVRFFFLEI